VHCQQILQVCAHRPGDGVVGAEAPLEDCQGSPHLGQPAGGLEQPPEVVEEDGDVGMVGPWTASEMASARRISSA
jgi:hypothetical protein